MTFTHKTPFQVAISMTADEIEAQIRGCEAEITRLAEERGRIMKIRKDLERGLRERLLRDRIEADINRGQGS